MRDEMLSAAQVRPAAEIPEPGSGIQALPCANKHMRATPRHISLKLQSASQRVNPGITVSRAAFSLSAVKTPELTRGSFHSERLFFGRN